MFDFVFGELKIKLDSKVIVEYLTEERIILKYSEVSYYRSLP